ncbi:MAG: acetate kinase [Elusimicrobia bacterium]|nr:acetate kinase [Elusimicrobiota bacterium]
MNILVLNCGSSTVKFQVIATDADLIKSDGDRRLAHGLVERIGSQCLITLQADGQRPIKRAAPVRDHKSAIDMIVKWAISPEARIDGIQKLSDLQAVGHRVVHGGERFRTSALLDDEVMRQIEDCIELAPLHNPANLKGILAARELLGAGIPQVAVFDTAFHSSMPETSYIYGIPYQLYRRHKIRRYGFHGTSHRYVAYKYRRIAKLERDQVNAITLHLGSGCSACAIKDGLSFDTSMGFTPLEGLMMGTRCGDIDPSIIDFLVHKEGMSIDQVDALLNKQSGLLGVSGLTNDMRELLDEEAEHQDRRARLAIDIFCQRVRRYIGGYLAEMGGADAVIFTGGIGERSPLIRGRICAGLDCLGLTLDKGRNERCQGDEAGLITEEGAELKAYVIPTNEELLIARDAFRVVSGQTAVAA